MTILIYNHKRFEIFVGYKIVLVWVQYKILFVRATQNMFFQITGKEPISCIVVLIRIWNSNRFLSKQIETKTFLRKLRSFHPGSFYTSKNLSSISLHPGSFYIKIEAPLVSPWQFLYKNRNSVSFTLTISK